VRGKKNNFGFENPTQPSSRCFRISRQTRRTSSLAEHIPPSTQPKAIFRAEKPPQTVPADRETRLRGRDFSNQEDVPSPDFFFFLWFLAVTFLMSESVTVERDAWLS
jgi:hypothetical protein